MTHRPSADDLLEAVGEYLADELAPRTHGADAFHLRIAANVIAQVRREMVLGAKSEARAAARIGALLGREGAFGELSEILCHEIRARRIGPCDPELLDALQEIAADRLAIDNPRYATYRHLREPET